MYVITMWYGRLIALEKTFINVLARHILLLAHGQFGGSYYRLNIKLPLFHINSWKNPSKCDCDTCNACCDRITVCRYVYNVPTA